MNVKSIKNLFIGNALHIMVYLYLIVKMIQVNFSIQIRVLFLIQDLSYFLNDINW